MAPTKRSFRSYPKPEGRVPTEPVDIQTVAGVGRLSDQWALGTEWTPQRIAGALRDINGVDYVTCALDCAERYIPYASALQSRILGVVGRDLDVQGGDDSDAATDIAKAYQEHVVETEAFHALLTDLSSAISIAYSVSQPVWNTETRPWTYREFIPQDQRLFRFDDTTMRELRIRSQTDPEGIEIEPGSLIIHTPKIRPGVQIRGGLARSAVVAYMFSSQGYRGWSAFADIYGIPLRVAKYDSATMGPAEIAKLRRAVVNLASDAAAILPMDMDIEIKSTSTPSTSGDNVFQGLASYWDSMVYRLVLGGNLTAESGSGSYSQAKVHDDVRISIARADARALFATIREQVTKPWVLANYGPNASIPVISANVEGNEDLESFSKAITPLINAGLRISAQEVRDKFGLRLPTKDEETIIGSRDQTRAQGEEPSNGASSGSGSLRS